MSRIVTVYLWMVCLIGIGINFPLTLQGQFTITGIVLNAADSTPIIGAHLTINGIVVATSREPDGSFLFSSQKHNEILKITHISYDSREIELNNSKLIVYLKPSIKELQIVNISSKPYRNIISNTKMYLIDYTFYKNQLLAISLNNRKNKEAKLVLIGTEGDTTLSTEVDAPEYLFIDCFNNHHLIEKSMALQIYIDSAKISLIYPNQKDVLLNTFDQIIGYYDHKFLLRRNYFENQLVEFILFDELTRKAILLTSIIDEGGMERLSDKARLQSSEGYSEHDARFEAMCFYAKKDIITLFDSNLIRIFNTVDGLMEIYDFEGNLLNSVKMSFYTGKGWDKCILTDETNGKLYTHFTVAGITTLYEIDKTTAQINQPVKIPGINFAQKIKVNSGKIYFLYNDAANSDYKQLFAMNINH